MEKGAEVMTPEDAAFLHPPPSYEEVMGAYNTSIKTPLGQAVTPGDLPALAYVDIMPRCISPGNIKGKVLPKFDDFSATIEAVNQWLKDNPGLVAWKCETTENKLGQDQYGNLTFDLNSMLIHEATFGYQVYLLGLRLWLTKNPHPGSPPQQLAIKNIVPEKYQLPVNLYNRRGMIIMQGNMAMAGGFASAMFSFKGLNETLTKINKDLEASPLPGTILSIETAKLKAFESFRDTLDPEATCWSEEKLNFRRETQVVRIYYIKGPSAKEVIGMEDFIPELTDIGSSTKPPKFQPFESLMPRISHWLPRNQGVRVVNIQQFDAKVTKAMLGGEVKVESDSTDETINSFEQRMSKTLRLFYVKSTAMAAPMAPNCVTSRVFLPARIGLREVESMNKTMDRIDVWLRLTGVPILSVETTRFLFIDSRQDSADIHQSNYVIHGFTGKRWITGIRVYFPCMYQEPDPSLMPPVPVYVPNTSSSCTIL